MMRNGLVWLGLLALVACKDGDTDTDTDDTDTEVVLQTGELDWLATVAGPADSDWSHDMVVLADGSIAVAGSFAGITVAGRGEPNETELVNTGGGRDVWIAVFEADGTLRWARAAGAAGTDVPLRIAEADGAVWVHVVASGAMDHGGMSVGPGFALLEFATADGAPGDARAIAGAAPTDWARPGLEVLSDGSIVASGMFTGSITLDPGGPDEAELDSAGGFDLWLAKWDANGALETARSYGGTGDEFVGGLAREGAGFLFYGGFTDELVMDASTTLTGNGTDGFVAWLDADLEVADTFTWGGPGADATHTAAASADGIVFAGIFDFIGTGNPLSIGSSEVPALGLGDIALVRLDGEQAVTGAWPLESGGVDGSQAITELPDGDVAVAVSLDLPLVGPSSGQPYTVLDRTGDLETYGGALVRGPPSGDPTWIRIFDHGSVTALAAGPDGALYAAGDFQTGIVLGEGEPHEAQPESLGNGYDAFVMRLAP
jgi:hypothetical protein